MIEELKEKVFKANLDLVKYGLVIFTWGNVSAIDRKKGLVVIKPSGVSYETMKADDMVVLDLRGNIVEGRLKPMPLRGLKPDVIFLISVRHTLTISARPFLARAK